MSYKMDSFGKILAYQNIKPFLEKKDWEELAGKINIDFDSYKSRILGKDIEDAFFIIAQSYEKVDYTIAFNESISKLNGTPSGDGLVILKVGSRLLVEVKSTQKTIWKIAPNRFNDQLQLAQKMGFELYFVVFLNGFFGLFSSTVIKENNYRIKFPDDFNLSTFDAVFDSLLIKIPKGLKIIKYFSPFQEHNTLISYNEPGYGYLFKYQLIYERKVIDLRTEIQLMAFTGVEQAIVGNFTITELSNETKIITHECKTELYIYDFDLILSLIYRTMSSITNDYFDSAGFVTQALENLPIGEILNLKAVKKDSFNLIKKLINSGIPFEFLRKSEIKESIYPPS